MKRIIAMFFVLAVALSGGAYAATAGAPTLVDATPVPSPSPSPSPGTFTAQEKSVEALFEGVLMSSSMLVQQFGPAGANLSLSGTFSGSGWTATLSGTYGGQAVNLSYNGTFDPSTDAGTYTGSGSYGSNSWSENGDWSYTTVNPTTLDMLWNSYASIVDAIGNLFRPDKHFTQPKRWARSVLPDGSIHVADSGTYVTTYFGFPFGRSHTQISDYIYPPGGGGGGIATVSTQLADDGINLGSSANTVSGTVSGSISFNPNITKDPVPAEIQDKAAAQNQ